MNKINKRKYKVYDIVNAYRLARSDQDSILSSNMCGCFYCLAIFFSKDINNWIKKDNNNYGVYPVECTL